MYIDIHSQIFLLPRFGHLDRANHCSRLVNRFLVLSLGLAISHDAASGLDIHLTVLHHHGSERDAGIDVATVVDVSDRTAYGPRRVGSSSSITCIARTFGAPLTVPAGKHAFSASMRPSLHVVRLALRC